MRPKKALTLTLKIKAFQPSVIRFQETDHFKHSSAGVQASAKVLLTIGTQVIRVLYVGNSISKLQIQVTTYVFELSAGNCHR